MQKSLKVDRKCAYLGYASLGMFSASIDIILRHLRVYNIQEIDLRSNGLTSDHIMPILHLLHHDRINLKKIGLKMNYVG